MQTAVEKEDQDLWGCYYNGSIQPVHRKPDKILPSTTVIIYEPFTQGTTLIWRVLCHQRVDNGLWGFVGGAQEIGESLQECARREAYEETGISVLLERMVCVDSDPRQGSVMVYPDGGIVQYTNVTFLARSPHSWDKTPLLWNREESMALRWFSCDALPSPFSPVHTWRLTQALQINQHPPVR